MTALLAVFAIVALPALHTLSMSFRIVQEHPV